MTTYPPLTPEQLQQLGNLINAGNRIGFYLQLYDFTVKAGTPSSQVIQLAQISSLSGIPGDAAVYANALAAAEAQPKYGVTYPGIIPFSLQIATAEYNAIKGNSGILNDANMVTVAQGVWNDNGLGGAFPGWAFSNPFSLPSTDWLGWFNGAVGGVLGSLDYNSLISTWTHSIIYAVPPNGTLNVSADGAYQWYTDPSGNVVPGTVLPNPSNAGFWNGGAGDLQKEIQPDNAILWTMGANDVNGQPFATYVEANPNGQFEAMGVATASGSRFVAATATGFADVDVAPTQSGSTNVSIAETDGSPTLYFSISGAPLVQFAPDDGSASDGGAASAVLIGSTDSTLNGGSGDDLMLLLGDDAVANAAAGLPEIVVDCVGDAVNASNGRSPERSMPS